VSENKNLIITKKSREKLVKARAGMITLPKIIGMAFGDGGVDAAGKVIPPTDAQTELTHELLRKEIHSCEFLEGAEATVEYVGILEKSELVGKEISELGLYDEEGDIVCIKTFTRKGKEDDIIQKYTLQDIFD